MTSELLNLHRRMLLTEAKRAEFHEAPRSEFLFPGGVPFESGPEQLWFQAQQKWRRLIIV